MGEPSGFDLLKRSPKYFKEHIPLATVGVIPYTVKDGEVFILLGRETKDQTWSDFGGKVNTSDTTFAAALIRELYEETAGMIHLSDEQLHDPHTLLLYIHKPGKREIVYAFCRVDYRPGSEFLSAVRTATEESHKEKDQFRWLSLTEFEHCKTEDSAEYPLRSYFRDDLIRSTYFSTVIKKLREEAYLKNERKN